MCQWDNMVLIPYLIFFFFCILLQDVTEQIRVHPRTYNGRAISNVIIVNHRREASYLLHYLCHYVFVSGLWWYQTREKELFSLFLGFSHAFRVG